MSKDNIILEKFMEDSDPKTIWHIGSNSGFFFIGTKKEYESDIGKINDEFYKDALKKGKSYRQKLESIETDKIPNIDNTLPKKKKELNKILDFITAEADSLRRDLEEKEIDALSISHYRSKLSNNLEAVNTLHNAVKNAEKEKRNLEAKAITLKKLISKNDKYLESFVDVRKRKVTEVYDRLQRDGTIVSVEGSENGKFWFRSEYQSGSVPEEDAEDM